MSRVSELRAHHEACSTSVTHPARLHIHASHSEATVRLVDVRFDRVGIPLGTAPSLQLSQDAKRAKSARRGPRMSCGSVHETSPRWVRIFRLQ